MPDDCRFNLLDERWIPIAGSEAVSLKDVFARSDLKALGGSVLEKIALFKLLQAVAQAACTPKDDEAWLHLGEEGMAEACLQYLEKWRDAFWLYGTSPFLQFPQVATAECKPYGALMPEIADGNTTVLFHGQTPLPAKNVSDAQRARILVTSMSCCFGGKKTDKTVRLKPLDDETRKSAKPGPALGAGGLLHSFLTGSSVRQTVFFNLLTESDIKGMDVYTAGVGRPPWEAMPQGENDANACSLMTSLMGRLVPMARFLLLKDEGVHCVEGLRHQDYKVGMVDPSMASMDLNSPKAKLLRADPARRPWRQLPALLGFLSTDTGKGFICLQLKWGVKRLFLAHPEVFGIWSGGLRISSKAGETYVSGRDDAVESEVSLPIDGLNYWFDQLEKMMGELERIAWICRAAVRSYFIEASLKEEADRLAAQAEGQFWEKAEQRFPILSNACAEQEATPRENELKILRGIARSCYDVACPQTTARQMQLYIKNTPRFGKKS